MVEMAMGFASDVRPQSRYRCMHRSINGHYLSYDKVACFIMSLFGFLDDYFYLAKDKTKWQWGKKNLNIMMLAVVYKEDVAIPVYWLLLNK